MTNGNAKNPNESVSQRKLSFLFKKVESNPGIILMIVFCLGILYAIYRGLPVIDKLSEPSFARGLITFIICIATIGLAFILVYYAFAQDATDDRFRRAREVFAGLLGVPGTIVGFYFGSANTGTAPISIADIQVSNRDVVTYVTGGAPPYQGEIQATGKFDDATPIKLPKEANIMSQNGWINYTFDKPLSEAKVEINIRDSQNRTASKVKEYIRGKVGIEQAGKNEP